MAYEIPGVAKITFPAGGDLHLLQYHFVKLNSSGEVVTIAAATDYPVGILQNTPTLGQSAEIMLRGVSKLKATAAGFTNGDLIGPNATGYGVTLTQAANTNNLDYVCGQALETVANVNEIGTILLRDPYAIMIA